MIYRTGQMLVAMRLFHILQLLYPNTLSLDKPDSEIVLLDNQRSMILGFELQL